MANVLDLEMLKVALRSIDEFAERELPDSLLIDLDERDEFPEEIVRRMSSGDELGIQLLFVPFEYGGMGGGAFDVYRICERMAAIDLGLATSELATFLGSDPIRVGGTEDQKREYMSRIAKDGVLFAYGATEPEAGSDLGALKTIAEPVGDNGSVTGYRITGVKQWISNGGVADLYTILALAPGKQLVDALDDPCRPCPRPCRALHGREYARGARARRSSSAYGSGGSLEPGGWPKLSMTRAARTP